jgi:exonuclease SbcD
MGFSFLHCGDLHLGCFPNRLEERYLDFFNAFDRVINYAIVNKVPLILISGDMFHLKTLNSKTLQKTIDCLVLAKKHDIEVVVIEGNHDKAFYVDEESWLYFLNHQHLLTLLQTTIIDGQVSLSEYDGENGAILEGDNYRIIGVGYWGGATEKYLEELAKLIKPSPKFSILMLHAAINRLVGQDMGDVKGDIILGFQDKVNYIALGHIHNRYEFNNLAFNPGALENIRLKDAITMEDKGFYHVKVKDDNSFVATHIKSNPRMVKNKAMNVTGCKNPTEIEREILDYDFRIKPQEMLNLNLVGHIDFNPYTIKTKEIAEKLKEKYDLLHIEINNNINLTGDDSKTFTDFDFTSIIKNLIAQDLKYDHPEMENPLVLAQAMMDISDLINEEDNASEIENHLLKLGDKL